MAAEASAWAWAAGPWEAAASAAEGASAEPASAVRALEWRVSAGLGTVYSWTIVHRPVTPSFTTP
ncbi:hypothetical protein AB0C36_36595, partial [Streptodolium elevatio]